MQTFSGIEYLCIDIATNYGLGDKNWNERIDWTLSYEPQLLKMLKAIESDPKYVSEFMLEADEPALFFAGVQALRDAREGRASGYPISLDATSSGVQILACLTGCEQSAALCNVVDTGRREDAYTNIYQSMCAVLGDAVKIARKETKRAIMTAFYNSTAVPKEVFGTGDLLRVFYERVEAMAPGAWGLNEALKALWKPMGLSHDWVLPDNFHVHVKVMTTKTKVVHMLNRPVLVELKENEGTKEGRSLSPNLVHSIDGMVVREMHRRCDYDVDQIIALTKALLEPSRRPGTGLFRVKDDMVKTLWDHYQRTKFLSARILEYLDEDNLGLVDPKRIITLLKTMPEKPFKVMSIHD